MDAIDILGSLLGHKSSRAGKGTDVLNDIFKRGPRAGTSTRSTEQQPGEIQREAEELEDLLNVANDRKTGREMGRPQRPHRQPSARSAHRDSPFDRQSSGAAVSQDDRAMVLVRAMVNAAKSDGQIDQSEQQAILERLDDSSRETIDMLREEFAKPLDVREFAWSVPLGMEQQVYTLSLIAIDLDTSREASYLRDLAHGLRIPDEVREQIHQRLKAPGVY